jgi:hypothetical protein
LIDGLGEGDEYGREKYAPWQMMMGSIIDLNFCPSQAEIVQMLRTML